ncbi:MAG: MFS transporter [Bdellovibrionaceae bacterium]|nr:MFS transporter [Pseudobdellovibrionaceae bacterium]
MKFTKSELSLILVLSSIQFAHIIDFVIMMPLGPQLMRSLQINPGQFSLLVSSYTLAAGLSGLVASFFVDRFDRKNILLLFFVGFILGTLGCAFSSHYHLLLFARCFTGVFGGVLTSIVMSIVSDSFEYSRRGSAMGIVMSAFAAASIFGLPLGIYLANHRNWQTPFLVLGVLAIFIFALAFALIPKQNAHLQHKAPTRDNFQVFKMILSDHNQVLALILVFSLVLGQFTIIPFISPSFVLNAGLKEDQLPLIYLLGGFCSMFASPLMGRLADKYGKHAVFRVAVLMSLVSIYLITHLGPQPVLVILAISCFFFIVMSGRLVPSMALITATAPTEMRAGFLAIVSCVQQLSAATASWLAGMIIIESPTGSLEHFNYVGYIAILFSLLALFIIRKVQNTYDT